VEENANSKIDKIAKAWARVAKAAECSIVLVHHTSKAGSGEATAHSSRGAVALTDACRSAVVLNRMSPEAAKKFRIDEAERRRYFSAGDDKHNRAPAENADWYRLASVDLGNGQLGCGDSIGVAEPWSPPDWVGRAVADVLGLDLEEAAEKARVRQMLKNWIAEGALNVIEKDTAARQTKSFVEVGRWQNDTSATLTATVAEQAVAPKHQTATLQSPPFRGSSVATGATQRPALSQTLPLRTTILRSRRGPSFEPGLLHPRLDGGDQPPRSAR
jgi:hypothetical protein